ncbi:alpha/beta fold hydrolase [Arenimonas sp.]|uniref:alpha/beta fold hydrolase n=1 Tax=Arenimonas sp. TaxID=1872635 RepID=UPI0039E43F75
MQQRIHIARTSDHVQLAWARSGSGPVLVKASNWLSHLRHDLENPVWRHWVAFLTRHFDFIRFDERGCGLSDWQVEDVSERHWLGDLETVVDAAGIAGPHVLLGISQGAAAAIRYSIKYPERVSHLILYGGYARGGLVRGGSSAEHFRALVEMVRLGWGSRNPMFRQVFTARFVPGGSHEQLDWFNELARTTVSPEMALRLLHERGSIDIVELLPRVKVPTLVLHARHDEVVGFSEGKLLAAGIPGAQFVELDSRNHVLLEHEPAWQEFQRAVREFTGVARADSRPADAAALTKRERRILDLLRAGKTNAEIGTAIFISEKTVRNHLSSVYRKLGVSSRAQAIVKTGAINAADAETGTG